MAGVKTAVYSTHEYDRRFLSAHNEKHGHDLVFLEPRLTRDTALLAAGCTAVCAFVNDQLDAGVLEKLASLGVRFLALRSAGFNHLDRQAAGRLGLIAARVPNYSPYAVAEHAIGLILTLNRRLHRAFNRVREGNFSLDGLLGFDLHGRTVGVVGTGQIGAAFARSMNGFGCRVLAHDVHRSPDLAGVVDYVSFDELLASSHIVSLHCPLTPDTYHLMSERSLGRMLPGAMLINTSRGALVDTAAAIEALKSGQLGSMGLDVYEEEADLFFEDLSDRVIQDDVFSRLLTLPNVLVTGHQAFFTEEALHAIAETTLANLSALERGSDDYHGVPA